MNILLNFTLLFDDPPYFVKRKAKNYPIRTNDYYN